LAGRYIHKCVAVACLQLLMVDCKVLIDLPC